ncbi:MAG: pyrroline-5-carboxylate reductase [Lentisphaeria bacterium]|nr:pyrroline-5-carboxylate reductase [Lentisphaeria bacterium]
MRLAFLGAGKMATAIASGVVGNNVMQPADLIATDISPEARTAFTEKTGVCCQESTSAMFAECDALLLAVKPQMAEQAIAALSRLKDDCLIISIAAGIPIAKLSVWFKTGRIIRVMPNTPLMVGAGATVFACGPGAHDEDASFVTKLFGALGYVAELPEEKIDAVTALSGSGPAYIFEMVQALTEGSVALGLPPDIALDLTVQTVYGAARMLRQRMGGPEELRDAVTSPRGTTAAGLSVLAEGKFRTLIAAVVRAARDRSVELGKLR